MTQLKLIASSKSFGGLQQTYSHQSQTCDCPMKFSIYLPPHAIGQAAQQYPVLFYLAGRTANEQTFAIKSGYQRLASKFGIAVICPDTSPRDLGIPGENDTYLVGTGCSYYVDATTTKWIKYQMFSYISQELPQLIRLEFPTCDVDRMSIFGHSMGGHGALMCALKRPGQYRSVSAFAPVTAVSKTPRQVITMEAYLGNNPDAWKQYDVVELMKSYQGPHLHLLIDQGTADEHLNGSLLPDYFLEHLPKDRITCDLRMQEGYDHGYYFVATFLEDHFEFHARFLKDN